MSKVLDDRKYADSHEWVKLDGDVATIGISDYAQHAIGNITYIDLPEVDDEVSQGADFGAVESVKAASDLISPVSGVVIEVNEELSDRPELINEDAYENWIIKVKVSDPSELDKLMGAEDYKKLCEA